MIIPSMRFIIQYIKVLDLFWVWSLFHLFRVCVDAEVSSRWLLVLKFYESLLMAEASSFHQGPGGFYALAVRLMGSK